LHTICILKDSKHITLKKPPQFSLKQFLFFKNHIEFQVFFALYSIEIFDFTALRGAFFL